MCSCFTEACLCVMGSAGAVAQPQQACSMSVSALSPLPPLTRPDSSRGSSCQRSHRRGHEGQEDQAGGDERIPRQRQPPRSRRRERRPQLQRR